MYLRVPWIGKPSTNLEKEVKTVVKSCCGSISTRLVFTSKRMLPVARKHVLPTNQKSSVIYECKRRCGSRCVRRTSQQLQHRFKQYVPQWLRQQLDPSTLILTTQIVQRNMMGKPLDYPASFRPISKVFQSIVRWRLLFFLESNFILFPRQAGFRPGRFALDQILFFSHYFGWV